jgi:hypothetical protein
MKPAAVLLLMSVAACAQVAVTKAVTAPTATPAANGSGGISRQTFDGMEKDFDTQLARIGGPDHVIDILGGTRGLYLQDYGVVFTAEISLIQTPTVNPWRKEIPKEMVLQVRQRKLENLPLLKTAMHNMVRSTAMTLLAAGNAMKILKPNAVVVLSVRLLYLPYENTTGLPALITMRADLAGAMKDDIKTEEQF